MRILEIKELCINSSQKYYDYLSEKKKVVVKLMYSQYKL